MIEEPIPDGQSDLICQFLSTIDLFKVVPPTVMRGLFSDMKFVFLGGGEVLIEQGASDADLYILYHGRLRVFIRETLPDVGTDNSSEKIVGEVAPGEIVGEIAFLIHSPRTRTVRALRDSVLLKLRRETFLDFWIQHPHIKSDMALISLKRLIEKPKPMNQGEHITTLTVAPAGDSNHQPFAYRLVEELNKVKPTLLVNKEFCDHHLGKNVSQITPKNNHHSALTAWLQSLEEKYGYVVYVTDRQMTPWSHRCIRQADKLLFIAEDHLPPTRNSIEETIAEHNFQSLSHTELILLHPDDCNVIKGTGGWIKKGYLSGHHHLRFGFSKDWGKLIRFLTDRSFGVVLNGGGARGCAHIGVLKALEELNVPVDFIAGTSVGSFLGASYSFLGMSGLIEATRKLSWRMADYTFPFLSLAKGKGLWQTLDETFGDQPIEDLWIRFFCVSTNLTLGKIRIHDEGLIKESVRASMALPGIYPPVTDNNAHALVDGGIINNMPVDIMRKRICGGKILAVNCHSGTSHKRYFLPHRPWISGWQLLFQWLNPFAKKVKYENIYNIITSAISIAGNEHQAKMELEADYVLRLETDAYSLSDRKAFDPLLERGYRTSMEVLPAVLSPIHRQ